MILNLDERVETIIERVDVNNSGKIDYTEFIMIGLSEEKLLTKQRIQ